VADTQKGYESKISYRFSIQKTDSEPKEHESDDYIQGIRYWKFQEP
jgi:hypothetical protein